MREVMQDADRRAGIEALRPPGVSLAVTTLRLFDVATWMRFSNSENAQAVRSRGD
jgi:hypothetical protein